MSPQSAPHRRGGKHRVKDADKTHTKYDDYTYKELLSESKCRKLYRKDDTKTEMMQKLARQDQIERSEAHHAAQQVREARAREREKQERREKEKRDRKLARQNAGDDASESSMSEAEIEAYHRTLRVDNAQDIIGDVLSDISLDTSSSSSAPSTPCLAAPTRTLTLLESHPTSPPRKVNYTPLRLLTTHTSERLSLPGSKYPPHIPPSAAPLLSPTTRTAARNGHLVSTLRTAVIEPATAWARRTTTDPATGTLWFDLPARDPSVGRDLADVYADMHAEISRLRCGAGTRADRARRRGMRRRVRMRARAEAYGVCMHRPGIGYVPACLEGGGQRGGSVGEEGLEGMFYVRYRECDVPHYVFWVRRGEWEDPGVANPEWPGREREGGVVSNEEKCGRWLDGVEEGDGWVGSGEMDVDVDMDMKVEARYPTPSPSCGSWRK